MKFNLIIVDFSTQCNRNGPEVMKPLSEYLNHSECRFDLIKTLTVLPEDWPIKLIHRHLSNHLNRLFNSKFQSSFGHVLALSMAERQRQTKQRLINQSIRIDRNRFVLLNITLLRYLLHHYFPFL